MKIPDDIYYRVLDLATALVRASEGLESEAHSRLYDELRAVVDDEVAAGKGHPFLFETLADFTDDDRTALDLYQRGLEYANRPDAAAYRASILLSMAERYRGMGNAPMAGEYAGRAEEAAKLVDDADLKEQISEFLRE
jgi:hypothetical protein